MNSPEAVSNPADRVASVMIGLRPMNPLQVTICVICFGHHPRLAQRFLSNLYRYTRADQFLLRIGLNAACEETVELVRAEAREHGNIWIHSEPQNIFKSPLMARLFALQPIETDWVIWFDDDSFPYRHDWLPGLRLRMETQPDVDVWGNLFFTEGDEAVVQFIRTASWFRGKPFNYLKPSGEKSECPLLSFVEGGFWAAKADVLKALQWPDPRLVQNGEDYVFGEALRQNGFRLGRFKSGLRINQAERRCPSDAPCGYNAHPPSA
jgi:GT2 family glycosyltransferase